MQSSITQSLPNHQDNALPPAAKRPELWVIVALLAGFNIPLLSGNWNHALTFLPDAVSHGEWWRLLTFPFVHVSIYHLLIDGIAFVLLYSSLSERSILKRLAILGASAMTSLLVSLWADPHVETVGLCGLSGVGHGLMAVCALEMFTARDKTARAFGYLSFAILFLKCTAEIITGQLIFDLFHLGSVGVPIVICHAGGMLGALAAVFGLKFLRHRPDITVRTRSS